MKRAPIVNLQTANSNPMKYPFIIFILFLLASCSNKTATDAVKSENPSSVHSKLDLFKDLILDTFYVYSGALHEDNYPFKGTPMDSSQIYFLPLDIRSSFDYNKDFGACYKFPLCKSKIGLIARVFGIYESSAIKLFVFDIEKDSVVKYVDLANTWGDEGYAEVYSSGIFKDKENNLMILVYQFASYDHRANDDSTDQVIEHWNTYSLLKLSQTSVDTVSKDSATIVTKYPSIARQLGNY